jgi:hypothetical protein
MNTKTRLRAAAVAVAVVVGTALSAAPAQAHWTGFTHDHYTSAGIVRTCGWFDFWCKPGFVYGTPTIYLR